MNNTVKKIIVSLAVVALLMASTNIVSAATNAYLTVTGNMESPGKATAMIKNNTGTKRYGTIKIGTGSYGNIVVKSKSASLNPSSSINVSVTNANQYTHLYALGIIDKQWNPESGEASRLLIKIK